MNTSSRVSGALTAIGHQPAPLADGTFAISRGSVAATFWLGAFAGRNFHTKTIDVFDEAARAIETAAREAGIFGTVTEHA